MKINIRHRVIQCGLIISLMLCTCFVWADYTNEDPYEGFPEKITIRLANLDNGGDLIYVGVDLAVFQDEDEDGEFHAMDGKVKRFLTTSTNITMDLGSISDYKKGKLYKLAMRTLYVPTGPDNDLIIIAEQDNGKDGWILIPNTVFKPSYFASQDGDPFIRHTVKWNANRVQYNTSKIAADLSAMTRSAGTFWSGEKFVLDIETTEVIPAVRVSIKDTDYSETLTVSEITASNGGIYVGELWDEDMLNKWGNYIPEELTFTIDAMDGTDVLETFDVKLTVDNRDLYYRSKREF